MLPATRSSKATQEDLDVLAEAQEELRLLELRERDYKELAMRQGIRLDVGGAAWHCYVALPARSTSLHMHHAMTRCMYMYRYCVMQGEMCCCERGSAASPSAPPLPAPLTQPPPLPSHQGIKAKAEEATAAGGGSRAIKSSAEMAVEAEARIAALRLQIEGPMEYPPDMEVGTWGTWGAASLIVCCGRCAALKAYCCDTTLVAV